MAKRIGGNRRKTRGCFKKKSTQKGKISLTRYLQTLKEGDRVVLKAEPAIQKGMYFRRFHGKIGVVKNQVGKCYHVEIKDGGKQKLVIAHPVHLKKVQ